ncbi:MAG: SLBB domain-containing protein [Longimicrobiales bacterium]
MRPRTRRVRAAAPLLLFTFLGVPCALRAQEPPPVVTPPPQVRTGAQDAAARAGYAVTNAQIADAIRRRGLTAGQLRAQLEAAGYDPGLADPFFSADSASARGNQPSGDFVAALQSLGIVGSDLTEAEVGQEMAAGPRDATGGVFGKDIFRRANTAFDPVTSGPVDPGFRLGVGDQLQLILTGEVELAYALQVRRDGTVVVPQVGQIALAGLTLEGARTLLTQRAGQSYSGLQTGRTQLDLTIARIRSNAVFVIGEVEDPGAYQVNALGTVFHALARAGGPTDRGSFRAVELRRGGRVVRTLDLYSYLLDGDAAGDVRLEQGDVIYVPVNQRAVAVQGAVRRPGIFELASGEGLADLVRFAGGFSPQASLDRVQVDRILPAGERAPGFDRVKLDLVLGGQLERGQGFPLVEGDILTVLPIGDLRRNTLNLAGAVFLPGEYEFRPGMTLDSLLARAQGLLPFALRDRVLVRRLVPTTGRSEALSVSLDAGDGGRFLLEEFDEVEVLDGRRDYPAKTVTVLGAVNAPGERPFLEFETLRAFVDRAGGFQQGAQLVEVARRRTGAAYSDTTSTIFNFLAAVDFDAGGSADQFVLHPDDRMDVRLSPGYRPQRFVTVAGQFRDPGTYAVAEGVERLSELVERAGGVLPNAYPASFMLVRDGLPVALDFERAMRHDPRHDFPLRSGDLVSISLDPHVVRVEGAVVRPSLIRYQPGRSVLDYIELAGGPDERGQLHKAVVEYPNGYSRRVQRHLWLVNSQPEVISGAVITVPAKPESTAGSGEVFTRVFQVASSITSLILAWVAITR